MRITRTDEKFRRVTEDSRLCVWHTTPQFDRIGKNLEGCLAEYDPQVYWYYYRWPPDAPYPSGSIVASNISTMPMAWISGR
ncbi:MAG TPA: hypothetical protein EYP40_07790 [Chromatiales bacterium]|nr:hypothetical protein [Chromatiales bacterium]